MPTKFYLHRGATPDTGTLPATNASISATTPTWTPGQTNGIAATPLLTNLSMNATISAVAQTSLAYLTNSVQTDQKQPLLRWCSAAIAAQTIAVGQFIDIHFGASYSNANSAFELYGALGVWRPGSGALVNYIGDTGAFNVGAAAITEFASSISISSSLAVTAQDGDILVLELWRDSRVQTMSTSYTNTVFYDGTVESSATDNAAYLLFANDVALSTGAVIPPGIGPVLGMLDHALADGAALY